MAQFKIKWFNAAVLSNPNSISQRVVYKRKTDTDWLSTGFTPSNDLPKTATEVTSPVVAENVVWQFKSQVVCQNGIVDNDDGVKEALKFLCFVPVLAKTYNSATITVNITGTDISKARFTLKKTGDNTVVYGPVTVSPVSNSISTSSGAILDPATSYYWESQYYATINNVEVISPVCTSDNITTDDQVCSAITGVTVESIEV